MRSKPFTFKKTVRKVEHHNALEINLTVQEAADLKALVGSTGGWDGRDGQVAHARDEVFTPLYKALAEFLQANPGVKPRITAPFTLLSPATP